MMAMIILEHSGYDLDVLNKKMVGYIYIQLYIQYRRNVLKQHLGVWQLAILLKIYI